jgi:D-alanine-D-alanine ligase
MSKTRVAIICGGRSSEHEISCISASGILGAIDRSKFEPTLIGISKKGAWILLSGVSDFVSGADGLPAVPERANEVLVSDGGFTDLTGKRIEMDLAFPILHGAYGEDGTIQGLFEMVGVSYVGSGVLASSVAMDKSFAKPIFAGFGLKVAPGFTISERGWKTNRDESLSKLNDMEFPLFIKPARSGSSRGTTKVNNSEMINAALEIAFQHDPRALVESAIKGREIECAVLEIAGKAAASVLGEIKVNPPHEFYDFEAKYLDGSTSFEYPANISTEIAELIRVSAITAFEALGCEGLARVDFFLTDDDEVIINELNTMPGFTPRSVFPMLWSATGLSYQEVITELCNGALSRSKSVIR